ncbi:FAD-binding domain-containing protein [Rhizopogon vinicolor AM-OR11-026]|uniref:FAD-binding domain-containing protein n=1 Tax=Rhizopogon vinicolor AM-OR11-026 TaxID=1314800 RepID=A0A1B7N1K6_9AGAM|nr:FAD-binding domain-containing protein [Rhizopogon vinicolor AM-OR11-026]
MSRLITLITGLSFALFSASTEVRRAGNYAATCQEIATSVSSSASKVYYNGSPQYTKDNDHWASSSSQTSACSFEPATAQDVGIALQILAKDQTPFAVKSGGHSAVPGFSSTPGVQIALFSFSEIVYDASADMATIGMGLIWDDVYTELEQYDVTVVGATSPGVGIGGVILGGGYSYLSNQYGLSLDNAVAFELVMPNGTVASITSSSDSDLFFGLRGGFNNFGIVTTVTVKTYPQSQVWGGRISYAEAQWDEVNTVIANFVANVSDTKAFVHSTGDYAAGEPFVSNILFYDAPEYPDGIFDDFLAIEHFDEDLSTRSYSDLILTLPTNVTTGFRVMFSWVPLEQFTPSILEMVKNQTEFYGAELMQYSTTLISYDVIPYLPSLYDHYDTPSAFPSSRDSGQGHSFIELYYGWTNPDDDAKMHQVAAESVAYMKQFIVDAGQDMTNALLYPNCAPSGTALEDMYGDALERLQSIRSAVDPDNVMSLTGGWRF